MTVEDHRRSPNIWFYKTGIGGEDKIASNGWKLRTLQTLTAELGDSNVRHLTSYVGIILFDNAFCDI
jgi:hypothetical protein